jgi:hypothetical protein
MQTTFPEYLIHLFDHPSNTQQGVASKQIMKLLFVKFYNCVLFPPVPRFQTFSVTCEIPVYYLAVAEPARAVT